MISLSIIIPFYNTSLTTLQRCLTPFLKTSYNDIEVILVDDCSTVIYGNQVTKLIQDAPTTIRLYRHSRNAGQNAARETGIQHASGIYTAFLDSDDYFDATEFAKVLHTLQNVTAQAYSINALTVDDDGNSVYDSPERIGDQEGWLPTKEAVRKCASFWHWIIRTNIIRKHPLNTSIRIGEDLVSLIPILADCDKIYSIDATPYRYVHHDESTMHTARMQDRLQLMDGFAKMLQNNPKLLQDYHDEVEWQAVWHILFWEALQILQSRQESSREYKAQSRRWIARHFPNWRHNPYVRSDPQAKDIRFRLITNGHYTIFSILSWIKHR